MGSGYKNFTAGSVLTASDVNNYLMTQSVMYFASAAARDAAITSPTNGMMAYIGSGDDFEGMFIYRGSAWKSVTPSGVVQAFAGSTAPNGWLLCYGQAISRTTYADLFAAIGTTHGAGNGSSTFNLPDLRGRVAAGKDDMGGSAANRITSGGAGITATTLGATGGTETHQLTEAQNGPHSHTQGSHSHSGVAAGGGSVVQNGTTGGTAADLTVGGGSYVLAGLSSATPTINSSGSGSAHQNTQPTLILNYIIKV